MHHGCPTMISIFCIQQLGIQHKWRALLWVLVEMAHSRKYDKHQAGANGCKWGICDGLGRPSQQYLGSKSRSIFICSGTTWKGMDPTVGFFSYMLWSDFGWLWGDNWFAVIVITTRSDQPKKHIPWMALSTSAQTHTLFLILLSKVFGLSVYCHHSVCLVSCLSGRLSATDMRVRKRYLH